MRRIPLGSMARLIGVRARGVCTRRDRLPEWTGYDDGPAPAGPNLNAGIAWREVRTGGGSVWTAERVTGQSPTYHGGVGMKTTGIGLMTTAANLGTKK